MEQKQRVIVYIDGFNFYFGLKSNAKWKKYYWLDIVKLFEMFMSPNQELVAVKYFSAKPDDINQSLRQNLKKSITCFNCGNVIHTHEEKETDVRIATQIVADAYQKNCDISIVVSADSDMIPAIELATEACQKVFVYFPPYQYSNNLATMGMGKPIHMKQYETRFRQCLLPDVVHLGKANFDLQIPKKWKAFQSI